MSLETGKRLGPYEIASPIGAGGMGEVYKATDTRLDRTVAIKVLPEHLAEDAERKQRFEREAKVISQLNHPHICTLHDIGEQDGLDYLVMEYIEGETLAERLKKGALPVEKALEFATQIADGLDKAHRAGIVHRDLKPANVMLTPSGVKILDFGLATTVLTGASSDGSDAPTQQKDLTKEHAVIGTLQYMAPEQLEGRPADARADVWAYGLLLSEMVTGRKVFDGASQASLIGAILHTEPARLSAVEPKTPASLDWAVQRCLAKDPDDRWQSMRDLLAELKRPAPSTSVAERHTTRTRPHLLLAVGLLGAALGALGMRNWSPSANTRAAPSRFQMVTPADAPVSGGYLRSIAIAPDGSRIVYATVHGLYVRKLDELEAVPLRGGEGGTAPFFSPDGLWVGFQYAAELKKVAVSGGPPTTICEVGDEFRGATWGADDTIVFGTSGFGLKRVPASGGVPMDLTSEDLDESPEFLPSGTEFVYATGPGVQKRLAVYALPSGQVTDLGITGSDPRFAATGHLLFVSQGSVHAVPFDVDSLSVRGPSRPVLENIDVWDPYTGNFAVARNGTLVHETGTGNERQLVWVDRQGRAETLPLPARRYYWARISPDGQHIAVHIEENQSADVWLADADRGTLTRLTTDSAVNRFPIWTPDGERIVFASSRDGAHGLYATTAGGRSVDQLLVSSDTWRAVDPYSWSPSGDTLIFSYLESSWDLGRLSLDEREWAPFSKMRGGQGQPALSPDGEWMAFVSTVSGRVEVIVERFPELGDRLQVSIDGGSHPIWSPDGRELFYRKHTPPRAVMSVAIRTEPTIQAGAPEVLFEDTYLRSNDRNWDISPNGQRFLMVKGPTSGLNDIVVVLDWFEELERLVPTDD